MTKREKIPAAIWIALLSLAGTILTALLNPALVEIFVPKETAIPADVPIIQTPASVPTSTNASPLIIYAPQLTVAPSPSAMPVLAPTQSASLIGDCLHSDQWSTSPDMSGQGECLELIQ